MTTPAPPIEQISRPSSRGRRVFVVVVLLIVALAVFSGLWKLGTADWGIDEVIYREAGNAYLTGDYSANPEHPPLAKQIIGVSSALLGSSIWAVRLPGVLLALGTGFVLFALGRRMGGRVAGVAAAAIWLLLPLAPPPMDISITRYGMLEPAMVFLSSVALYCAWRWGEAGSPRWAAAAGGALGLAIAAKLPAALLLPVVLLPIVWTPANERRRVRAMTLLISAMAGGYVLPHLLGGREGIDLMTSAVALQAQHAEGGHGLNVIVAGSVFERPPWWSHLWWMVEQRGIAGSIGVGAALIGLVFLRGRTRILAFLATAVLVPLVVMSLLSVKLPHYHVAWAAPLALAAGMGIAGWWQRSERHRMGAAVAALLLIVAMAGTMVTVLRLETSNYAAAASFLENRGLEGGEIGFAGWPKVAAEYLPEANLISQPAQPPPVVILDPHVTDRLPDVPAGQIVLDNGSLYLRHDFGRIQVYVRE